MATGVTHWYSASLTGLVAASESVPIPVNFVSGNANTQITFQQMAGDRITAIRIKRVGAASATDYDIHVYKDSLGTDQAYSVYEIAFNADLKWDYSVSDLNIDARAAGTRLYVAGIINSGADPINVDVEIGVSQAIGGI